MKTEIKTEDWPNGQRKFEIPYVNGKLHGVLKRWHKNGNKDSEIIYVNGHMHGLLKWWYKDGVFFSVRKWYKDRWIWVITFPFDIHIPGDAEIELFFHPTPELK